MTLLDEGEIVLNEEIYKHPVSKVHGGCEECQRLLTVCPTKTDVGLSQTEDLYVMMPMDWSEPIDWGRWRRREHTYVYFVSPTEQKTLNSTLCIPLPLKCTPSSLKNI